MNGGGIAGGGVVCHVVPSGEISWFGQPKYSCDVDTAKVESRLAACNISKVVSNFFSYTAVCSDGSAVSWGDSASMLHV